MKKSLVAERVGFEPTVHETCTPVFETGTLNHSDTSPLRKARRKFTAMPTIVKKPVNRERGYGFEPTFGCAKRAL